MRWGGGAAQLALERGCVGDRCLGLQEVVALQRSAQEQSSMRNDEGASLRGELRGLAKQWSLVHRHLRAVQGGAAGDAFLSRLRELMERLEARSSPPLPPDSLGSPLLPSSHRARARPPSPVSSSSSARPTRPWSKKSRRFPATSTARKVRFWSGWRRRAAERRPPQRALPADGARPRVVVAPSPSPGVPVPPARAGRQGSWKASTSR